MRQGHARGPVTVKQHFVRTAAIGFLFSLVVTASFVKLDIRMMDHAPAYEKYSFIEIATLLSYTLSILYIPMFLAATALYPVFLRVFKFVSVKFAGIEKLPLEAFFFTGVLFFFHGLSYLCELLLASGFLPILISVPVYFLVLVLIFSKYRQSKSQKMVHKPILLGVLCLVEILVSANNIGGLSGLAEYVIKWSAVVLTIAGFVFIMNYERFAARFCEPSKEVLSVRSKRAWRIIAGFVTGIILFSFAFSVLTFLKDRREEELPSVEISSSPGLGMNVVLIVIDALRADHLGCYGYHKDTSPNIDSFAEENVLFEHCYTQASWTKPSVASIFTSLYPLMHGAISYRTSILPDEVTTIAEILKSNGYLTYGYVANPNVEAIFRYNQGFDFYDDYLMHDKLHYAALRNLRRRLPWLRRLTDRRFDFSDRDNAKLANERIIHWLEECKANDFFMYIHYMDPHDPYLPPSPYDSMFPSAKDDVNSRTLSLYDGEIRFNDEHLGRLFDKLKGWGIYDKSLIVVTSDHGEAFGEHNDTIHGRSIYNELLKVPLIIKYPESRHKGMRIAEQVRSIDILPSILDAAGVSDETHFEGLSVSALLANGNGEFCPYVYVDNDWDGTYIHDGIIEDNTWKYIYTEKSALRDIAKLGHEELYNLEEDPEELRNLIGEGGEVVGVLREKLDFYRKRCSERRLKRQEAQLDAETIRNLKSLGYLE